MDQRVDNRKADLILQIAGEVAERQERNRGIGFWDDLDGVLGIKGQNEILALCMGAINVRYSKKWIADRLYEKMKDNLPFARGKKPTRAGIASEQSRRSRWSSPGSFKSWLTNNEMQPDPADARRILDTLIDLAARYLVKHARDLETLKEGLRTKNDSIAAMVEFIVWNTVIGDSASWTARPGYVPRIASTFSNAPEAAAPALLQEAARRAADYLAGIEGPRLVRFTGPVHSGKKTAIRYLLSEFQDCHLRLADSTLLPTLALNLEELTPDEFVEQVFAFYCTGIYSNIERRDADQLPSSVKVDRIRQMARIVPACVIFGEIGRVDGDEIGRRLSGAYAEEIVSALLDGHDLTRLVLASHVESSHSFERQKALLCEHTDEIELPGSIPLSDVGKALLVELRQLDLPQDMAATGLSWNLSHAALQLLKRRGFDEGKSRFVKEALKLRLQADLPQQLVGLILALLTDGERLVAGMICSSSDGLRFSVLRNMLRVFRELRPQDGGTDRLTAEEVIDLLRGLDMLVQGRTLPTDPALIAFGSPREEKVYLVNESWRTLLLAEWWRRDPQAAKLVMLLIAREAGHQSRCMRVLSGTRTPASIGRDVQAVHALIVSADFTAPGPAADPEGDEVLCSEERILPPLDVRADIPSARNVIRYAFRQLYTRDLEGDDFRLLNVAEDARTRLRILMTFLSPETPWLLADEKPAPSSLDSIAHLTGALTPAEVIDLLASIGLAALRLQKFEILSAVCRLGEWVFAAADDRVPLMLNFMRLLRAEIDAALLLGGNPDVFLAAKAEAAADFVGAFERMKITDIVSRIYDLLDKVFVARQGEAIPIDVLMAQGKLRARLGEVLHAEGKLHNAGREFDKANQIEAEVRRRLPAGSSLAPVGGGRGTRSYIAYCIDKARTETYDKNWSTFIFLDELPIPISRRIPLTDPNILRAMRSFELNARRMHKARASDKVGIQIDGARLAVVDHQYARAFRLLDAANATRFGSGSSLEILLELFAIRTRYYLDAAVICLNANAKDAVFTSEDFIAGIIEYFGLPLPQSPLNLAVRLLDRATSCHKTYRRLALLHGNVMTPHVTYMRYLNVLHLAISSRMTDADSKRLLESADFQLEGVLKHLELSAFLMYLQEATRLKRGIETALAGYQ